MNEDKNKQNRLIIKAVEVISDNFGESTAKLYEEYYQTKSDKEIKTSLKELITELVGPTNAKKQLKDIR